MEWYLKVVSRLEKNAGLYIDKFWNKGFWRKMLKLKTHLSIIAIILFACSGEQQKTGLTMAPEFSLMDLDSVQHTLGKFKGEVILIHFWADWCAHCRQEFPELQAAYDSLKGQDFDLVSINSGQERGIAAGIRETYDLTFPVLLDPDKKVTESYGVRGLPTSYFVDRDGKVLDRHIGWLTRPDILETFARIKSVDN